MLRHTMVTVIRLQHGCKVKERRSKKVNKKYQKVLALHRVTLYNISVVRKGQEKSPKNLAQLQSNVI